MRKTQKYIKRSKKSNKKRTMRRKKGGNKHIYIVSNPSNLQKSQPGKKITPENAFDDPIGIVSDVYVYNDNNGELLSSSVRDTENFLAGIKKARYYDKNWKRIWGSVPQVKKIEIEGSV